MQRRGPAIAATATTAAATTTTASSQQQHTAHRDPLFSLKLLMSGALSAVVSRTCVAPLERLKFDLVVHGSGEGVRQVAGRIMRSEGLAGFWRGNGLNILRTAPFKALNFCAFDTLHQGFVSVCGDGNLARFAAGACAGVTATLVCFPLDVLRTRLMVSGSAPRYGGPLSTLAGIVRHEGVRALYSGCLPAVIGMAPGGAVFYGTYDLLKHRHMVATGRVDAQGHHEGSLDSAHMLLFGAMAGAASELIVYPLEVIRRRMQLQSMTAAMRQMGARGLHTAAHAGNPAAVAAAAAATAAAAAAAAAAAKAGAGAAGAAAAKASLASTDKVLAACSAIWRAEGLRGFYSGLVPNMLQVLPSAALSYYTYDTAKRLLKSET